MRIHWTSARSYHLFCFFLAPLPPHLSHFHQTQSCSWCTSFMRRANRFVYWATNASTPLMLVLLVIVMNAVFQHNERDHNGKASKCTQIAVFQVSILIFFVCSVWPLSLLMFVYYHCSSFNVHSACIHSDSSGKAQDPKIVFANNTIYTAASCLHAEPYSDTGYDIQFRQATSSVTTPQKTKIISCI